MTLLPGRPVVDVASSVGRVPVGDGWVRVLDDVPADCRGQVVVASPFGMQGRDLFPLSYLLNANGFRTLRFDGRDSVGQGSGRMVDHTLSALVADLAALDRHHPGSLLLAVSLAGRSALRCLARGAGYRAAVLVTPVVDARRTVEQVLGVDHVGVPQDDWPATFEVMGHVLNHRFLRDCIDAGLVDLPGSLADAGGVAAPVTVVAGEDDPWVRLADVEAVARAMAARAPVRLVRVPAASHELTKNPVVAKRFFVEAVREALRLLGDPAPEPVVPTFAELIAARSRRAELEP